MQLKLKDQFGKRLQKRFSNFDLKVGILQNDEHKSARPSADGLSSYAGGPVRKKGRSGSVTLDEVSSDFSERLGFNYLSEPFKKRTSDIIKFTDGFLKMVFGKKGQTRRVENLLQAIVRNPILRGDYGSNAQKTQKIKGFNRYGIDTGQLFKAIRAAVTGRGRGV